jgi:hypothetical protein
VGIDGTVTLETKPDGLLGVDGISLEAQCLDGEPVFERTAVTRAGRKWTMVTAPRGLRWAAPDPEYSERR